MLPDYRVDFTQVKPYLLEISQNLNQQQGYSATYKKCANNEFLQPQDSEYLEIIYTEPHHNRFTVKMNLLYSVAYEVVELYFMVYNQDMRPLTSSQVYEQFKDSMGSRLGPGSEVSMILSANPLNNSPMYCLHGCSIKLPMRYLIPSYLELFGLRPEL